MRNTFIIHAALASLLVACSQTPSEPTGGESAALTLQDLTAVQQCASEAKTCTTAATSAAAVAACKQELKSCLSALFDGGTSKTQTLADGGTFAPPGFSDDAGLFPPIVGFDASAFSYDASFPPIVSFDAGALLPAFDASLFAFDDGGFPGSSCIAQLQSCLSSASDPAACATQVATCLQQAL
jgi:hypothetical protein